MNEVVAAATAYREAFKAWQDVCFELFMAENAVERLKKDVKTATYAKERAADSLITFATIRDANAS